LYGRDDLADIHLGLIGLAIKAVPRHGTHGLRLKADAER
jgi:hypothetical protein